MRKDEAKVHARAHGTVQPVAVNGQHPVGLERQAQGLAHGIFHTHIGVNGQEGLLVEHGFSFRLPVVLVALEHIE